MFYTFMLISSLRVNSIIYCSSKNPFYLIILPHFVLITQHANWSLNLFYMLVLSRRSLDPWKFNLHLITLLVKVTYLHTFSNDLYIVYELMAPDLCYIIRWSHTIKMEQLNCLNWTIKRSSILIYIYTNLKKGQFVQKSKPNQTKPAESEREYS